MTIMETATDVEKNPVFGEMIQFIDIPIISLVDCYLYIIFKKVR